MGNVFHGNILSPTGLCIQAWQYLLESLLYSQGIQCPACANGRALKNRVKPLPLYYPPPPTPHLFCFYRAFTSAAVGAPLLVPVITRRAWHRSCRSPCLFGCRLQQSLLRSRHLPTEAGWSQAETFTELKYHHIVEWFINSPIDYWTQLLNNKYVHLYCREGKATILINNEITARRFLPPQHLKANSLFSASASEG